MNEKLISTSIANTSEASTNLKSVDLSSVAAQQLSEKRTKNKIKLIEACKTQAYKTPRITPCITFEKLIIIGEGPASYTAAIHAARSLLEPLIISKPPLKKRLTQMEGIENFPGFPDEIQS